MIGLAELLASDAEFTDPRLLAAYDTLNPYRPDAQPGFYAGLAAELGATTIVDLGCGTGMVTCELARRGHRMIGVDPAPGMLAQARRRPGAELVRWVDGGVEAIGTPAADLAVMTGHVAQFFVDDVSWDGALAALRAGLAPGGRLAFETRNPAAREWERWTAAPRTRVVDPVLGPIEKWVHGGVERDGIVYATLHHRFLRGGARLMTPGRLRFRTEAELRGSLRRAGFRVERCYGDWDRRPVGPSTPELIVVAVR